MSEPLFEQCFCVLLKAPMALEEIVRGLQGYTLEVGSGPAEVLFPDAFDPTVISKPDLDARPFVLAEKWLTVSYPKWAGSRVVIDVVNEPWDDTLGDPDQDARRYLARTLGALGGHCYPGALERAIKQLHANQKESGRAQEHQAYVRLRLLAPWDGEGAGPDPKARDWYGELEFMSWMVLTLLDMPGAVAYLNPAAELIIDRDGMARTLEQCQKREVRPLALWVNRREFDHGQRWWLLDTLGNGQLGLPDLEVFMKGERPSAWVPGFMTDVSQHMYGNREPIEDKDLVTDAIGNVWQASNHEASLGPPSRRVVMFKLVGGGDRAVKAGEEEGTSRRGENASGEGGA